MFNNLEIHTQFVISNYNFADSYKCQFPSIFDEGPTLKMANIALVAVGVHDEEGDLLEEPVRLPRHFTPRDDNLGVTYEDTRRRFRLNRDTILHLCHELEGELQSSSRRNHAVPVLVKVTSALHFSATGSFQRSIGLGSGVSQSSVSRYVSQFTAAMLKRTHQHISFPRSPEAIQTTQRDFFRIAGFPQVLGAIDCTHIPIIPPKDSEAAFRNRKSFHSINVQATCDANYFITDVCANYPGSCHDSFILQQSGLHQLFDSREITGGWLLGKYVLFVTSARS